MSIQDGIIAGITARPGKPSYRGYDLKIKDARKTEYFEKDNFELVFQGFECKSLKPLDPVAVLKNIDHSIFKIYKDPLEISRKSDLEEAKEPNSIPVNGKIIKELVKVDDHYRAELISNDLEEAKEIVKKMFDCFAAAKEKQRIKQDEIYLKMKAGTLDLCVFEGKTTLVYCDTPETFKPVEGRVDVQLIKNTIFYITDLFVRSQEFINQINVTHEENGYICEVVKGKMNISKMGSFTELERTIAKDLLKLK